MSTEAQASSPPPGEFVGFDFPAGRVFALGLTYADHIREPGEKTAKPVVFMKRCAPLAFAQRAVAAPSPAALGDAIRSLDPELADWLGKQFENLPALFDYEAEIGCVLFEDVTVAQLDDPAWAPQIGLFVANDLTVRSVQIAGEGSPRKVEFWAASKSFADFLPTGDKIWRAAQPDIDRMPAWTLETRVNGQVRQSAASTLLNYTPRQLLRYAAQYAPDKVLRRHDLVLTGTPAGIALLVPAWKRRIAALLPRHMRIRAGIHSNLDNAKFLRPGDQLTFSAGWLGSRTLVIT